MTPEALDAYLDFARKQNRYFELRARLVEVGFKLWGRAIRCGCQLVIDFCVQTTEEIRRLK